MELEVKNPNFYKNLSCYLVFARLACDGRADQRRGDNFYFLLFHFDHQSLYAST